MGPSSVKNATPSKGSKRTRADSESILTNDTPGGEGGVVQGNAASFHANVNAAGFQNENPRCYGCYGRDENGADDLNYDGYYSNNCSIMWDLANRGCIHKFGQNDYKQAARQDNRYRMNEEARLAVQERANDYYVTGVHIAKRVPQYCSMTIAEHIRTIPEWASRDWAALKVVLLKEFRDDDDH
ncbi:hypothetical protein NA56DRAFT_751327 [Hyaloscypha hepaticicola]|uniref:Uncharacterized protein n=1 Tax=Hyaloscypha hepaticicola TaxID=2082293 RepID=A0A2J6PXA2_9HELO|nr:hypothetical protein NA56DRAFT_751327 [Hyaloscypha hepaticicola]